MANAKPEVIEGETKKKNDALEKIRIIEESLTLLFLKLHMKTKILYGALFLNMALLLLSFSEQPVKLFYRYKAFLACTQTDSVHIVKTDFDQMMTLPICAKIAPVK